MPQQPPDDLRSRIAELESRVRALEAGSAPPSRAEPGASASASDASASASDASASASDASASEPAPSVPAQDPLWALRRMRELFPSSGAVMYSGAVDVGLGHVEYQWTRPTDYLLQLDWAELAERVTALGHPLRLAILRRLLDGERTVAQLVDELELASTGVAYHHLSALQNGGWVSSPRRGSWAIPVARVVPLLTIITTLEEG